MSFLPRLCPAQAESCSPGLGLQPGSVGHHDALHLNWASASSMKEAELKDWSPLEQLEILVNTSRLGFQSRN